MVDDGSEDSTVSVVRSLAADEPRLRLLEAPHPYIAVGTEGTKSATEFIPRFHRSFDSFLAWFCGDWERASHATTPPPTRSAAPEHD